MTKIFQLTKNNVKNFITDHQKFQLEQELVIVRDELEKEGRTKAEAEVKLKNNNEELSSIKREIDDLKFRNSMLVREIEQ